jgi:3-phosphoshikimate 1-carboxyvinyltransferase
MQCDSAGDVAGLSPLSLVSGTFRAPGSKSAAQRALLLAALGRGWTRLEGLDACEDVQAACDCLAAMGVASDSKAGEFALLGCPPGETSGHAGGRLGVGESGTLARLLTALVAFAARPGSVWTIQPRGTLLFRRSLPLFRALVEGGVELRRQNLPGTWPVELVGRAPPAALRLHAPVSSQEVSGLLLVLSAHAGERTLSVEGGIPSEPYVALTTDMIARFGAQITRDETGPGRVLFRVQGPLVAPSEPLRLEPDASSAAVALAAACLSGGEVLVPGLGSDSRQGDVRIVAHLSALGCRAEYTARGLRASGFPTRGGELDCRGEPDLAPVLCVVAAGAAQRAGATTRLLGLGTLPGKESDRLTLLATALRTLGFAVDAGLDWLSIAPASEPPPGDVVLDPGADHRMVFAFALLGLLAPGVRVRNAQCVKKSWPSFWSDLAALGAKPLGG